MTAATAVAMQDEPEEAGLSLPELINPTRAAEPIPRRRLGAGSSLSASPLALACDALETAYWHLLSADPATMLADEHTLFTARLVLLEEEQRELVNRRYRR